MKLPEKPHNNANNFERLAYYRLLQEYNEWKFEQLEQKAESIKDNKNAVIGLLLGALMLVCGVVGYLLLKH